MRLFADRTLVRPAAGLALFTLLLLGGCGELFSGDDAGDRTNWAVVVGISRYQSSSLNLKWADEDALDVYDALRRSSGWESDNITLLTNDSATKAAIETALANLSKRVSADDQVVFYFSGRGSFGPDQPPFDEGDGLDEYLAPYDALANSSAQDLSDDEIEELFSALPTNNVLIILDSGFAGNAVRATAATGTERFIVRSGSGRAVAPGSVDGMGHDLARPGYMYITAAQNGVAPSESGQLRNGVFTYYFVEGLRGAANPGNKTVSAQQAFDYAAPRTAAAAPGQAPQLVDNRGKSFRVSTF